MEEKDRFVPQPGLLRRSRAAPRGSGYHCRCCATRRSRASNPVQESKAKTLSPSNSWAFFVQSLSWQNTHPISTTYKGSGNEKRNSNRNLFRKHVLVPSPGGRLLQTARGARPQAACRQTQSRTCSAHYIYYIISVEIRTGWSPHSDSRSFSRFNTRLLILAGAGT
eukprot:COSAG06_NODE_1779_length_8414_cov_9.276248_1_plen_166_part_00